MSQLTTIQPVVGFDADGDDEIEMIHGQILSIEEEVRPIKGSNLEDWLPEFFMRASSDMDAMEDRIKKQSKAMLAAIKARRAGLAWKFGSQFQSIVTRLIDEQSGKKKSFEFFNGRSGYRAKKGSITVADEPAFQAWFDQQPDEIKAELEACFDRRVARKTPITEYVMNNGDIPDGIEFIEAHDSFFPKINVPELPSELMNLAADED